MTKAINTSLFDFPTLVRDFIYVDKTAQIYKIAQHISDRLYFLSRPRRFGKSLLVSTLKALFEGRRELFRGLAIEQTDWDWEHEVYPVLHLDMSTVSAGSAEQLEIRLQEKMRDTAAQFGLPHNPDVPAASNFSNLLRGLHQKSLAWQKAHFPDREADGRIVVLIDEYDAPVAGFLDLPDGPEKLPAVRKVLHDFYVMAKADSGLMRFLLVTGVSKFAKLSIFSAFNNPCDLTLDDRAADLLGYTHEEMERYFHDYVQVFADAEGVTYEQMFAQLLDWYDSYQFCPERLVKVVNPVSLGRALSKKALRGYWEATAGSTLIFEALKAGDRSPLDFASRFGLSTLDSPDALAAPASALLYQGGYLTIDRKYDDERVYLRIPNNEVRRALEQGYLRMLLGRDFELDEFELAAEDTAEEIAANGMTEKFRTLLQSVYSRLPHDWACRDEKEAKRYFLAFMVFAKAEVSGEPQHATGRPDAVFRTEKGVYVFEFKFAKSADAALAQCRERNYAAAFADDPRPIWYVGLNYNPADGARAIDDVKAEQARGSQK